MDLRKLKTLIDLVQASGIAEIEINEEGDHVRIVNRLPKPLKPHRRLSRFRRQLRPRPHLCPPQRLLPRLPRRPPAPQAALR